MPRSPSAPLAVAIEAPTASRVSPERSRLALVGVLAVALIVFSVPAGRRPLWSSDEARFALLARDILEHGRWLVPHLRGDLYLNKPQLYFWSIALLSLPGGRVTELTATLPSVVSAVATVGAVVAIGRLLWSPSVGLLAGLVLVSTPPFYAFSHEALADTMLTAFGTWALYFVLRGQNGGGAVCLLAFYGCIGGAVLAKGPAGLAVLLAAFVGTAIGRGPAALAQLKPLYGVSVLAIVALVWLAPYLLLSEGRFVSRVLVGHYAPWYLGGGLVPRLAQFQKLLSNFLPWTVLLVAAAGARSGRPDAARRWLVAATISLTLALGLAGHQRARYLLPIYPLLALLVAEFVGRAGSDGRWRALRGGAWTFAASVVGVGLHGPVLLRRVAAEDRAFVPDRPLEMAAVVALVLGAGLVQALAVRRERFVAGSAAAALLIAAALVVEGVAYPPRYARDNDLRPVAAAAVAHTPAGMPVVAHPDARLSLDFYVGGAVVEAATSQGAASLVERTAGAVVTTPRHWPALAQALPPTARVVADHLVAGRHMLVVVP